MLLLTAAKLKTGKILDLSDNTLLTSGKLLHMKTTSPNTINQILIELEEMTTGIGMKMEYEDLTNGTGLLIDSGTGTSLTAGGTLLSLHGEKQSGGTMLYIKASDLSIGSAITVESSSSLTSGTLLNMSTTTRSGHADGLVRLTANEMTTGVGMKINTKDLTT